MSAFERDTAVEELGGGSYRGRVSRDWFTPRGANGGFLAAIVLRAIMDAEPEAERAPRSLTLHYLRPPGEGELTITVTEERRGRQLTTYSARARAGRPAVHPRARGALEGLPDARCNYGERMPDVAAAERAGRARRAGPAADGQRSSPPRPRSATSRSAAADEALTGGWIAFAGDEPSPLDAPALALLSDAWLPSPFVLVHDFVGVPTIDLTIHFRARSEGRTGPALAVFRSRTSAEGFFEEDGELWSQDGTLLAQSRQLGPVIE